MLKVGDIIQTNTSIGYILTNEDKNGYNTIMWLYHNGLSFVSRRIGEKDFSKTVGAIKIFKCKGLNV